MDKKNIPNLITAFRFVLVVPILWSLLSASYEQAFYLFLLAGVSDGLDGFLARRFQWSSEFGAIMDPLADKLLMFLTYIVLGYLGHIPYWLVILVVGRDIVIIIGVLVYRAMVKDAVYCATFISKVNTVLQLALVTFILFDQVYRVLPQTFLVGLTYVVGLTTVLSLINYIWLGSKTLYQARRGL